MLPPPVGERRRAIVLVHGAWVGEWSWTPVLGLLAASGRTVHAVSLTGHGARSHQSGPHVTLADHVADVVGLVTALDLFDITLVGHSYGGRVISGAYPALADRIERLVYIDAHVPIAPDTGQTPERLAAADAGGGMLAFDSAYAPDPVEVGGPEGVGWFMARLMPQSFATFTMPDVGPLPEALPKVYVFASGNQPSRFDRYAAAAAADPAWEYHELPGSHWLMFSHPRQVADIILA